MFKLPQSDTKSLLAIHGWSGILLGLLLYAVICTGVAAVFASELNDWASPLARRNADAFGPGFDATVRRLAGEVDPQFHEEIATFSTAGGRLLLLYHKHETGPDGKPSERGVEFEVDPASWQVLERREGWIEDIAAERKASGVADFLVNLHVRLHIPDPYGLIVTGVLGLAMMIAAVTGLLIHRHLFKELFTLRFGRDPVLRRRDLHVVAGSWNLPFAFILAFTGSFFSFASTIGLPLVAGAKFGGDQEALIETLYGAPRQENKTPAAVANVEQIVADARNRAGAEPTFLAIEHYGRADARATVFTEYATDDLIYSSHLYDGVSGAYLQEMPPLGQVPSAGAVIVGLMYPLHFGHFAGTASKAVWVALGFAGAYVTFTGMLLWTRRRREELAWRRMDRVVHYVGYGLPLALICAPYGYFLLRHSAYSAEATQGTTFLAVAAVVAVTAWRVLDLDRLRRALLLSTGLALLGLPLVRMASGGPGWSEMWQAQNFAVPCVDLALLLMGAACLWNVYRARAPLPVVQLGRAESEPRTT